MELQEYLEGHISPPSETLMRLERITWQKMINPRMCSGSYQGRWLSILTQILAPKVIIELGTFTGYSTLCMLEGLSTEGKLHTVDINDELKWVHDEFLMDPRISRHYMPAELFIQQQDWSEVDLIFIDADKSNYLNYWEQIESQVKKGTVVLLDNVLWNGKVLQPTQRGDIDTEVLKQLNTRIASSPAWHSMIIPIRDGITLARKS